MTRKILTNFINLIEIPCGDLITDIRYSVYVLVNPNKFKLKVRGVRRKTNKIVEES